MHCISLTNADKSYRHKYGLQTQIYLTDADISYRQRHFLQSPLPSQEMQVLLLEMYAPIVNKVNIFTILIMFLYLHKYISEEGDGKEIREYEIEQ